MNLPRATVSPMPSVILKTGKERRLKAGHCWVYAGEIARITGGEYFRATDRESMEAIYRKIDALEKTPAKVKQYQEYTEHFPIFLVLGIVLLGIEILLGNTGLRTIP